MPQSNAVIRNHGHTQAPTASSASEVRCAMGSEAHGEVGSEHSEEKEADGTSPVAGHDPLDVWNKSECLSPVNMDAPESWVFPKPAESNSDDAWSSSSESPLQDLEDEEWQFGVGTPNRNCTTTGPISGHKPPG